jgi:hypothetical protein
MFARIEQGVRLPLNTVQFSAFTDLEPVEGALVVAGIEDGSPMIVQSPASAEGRLMLIASSVDGSAWNDWWYKSTPYVGVMQGAALYLSGYEESPPYYELGESVPVPEAGEGGVAVVTPDDERLTLSAAGGQAPRFFTPETAGVHELRVGPEIHPVAVNGPSSESVLDRIPPDDLLASVRRQVGEVRSGALLAQAGEANYAERQNWWWYLFLIALLVGIGEIYLGNRVTESARERRPMPDAT